MGHSWDMALGLSPHIVVIDVEDRYPCVEVRTRDARLVQARVIPQMMMDAWVVTLRHIGHIGYGVQGAQ